MKELKQKNPKQIQTKQKIKPQSTLIMNAFPSFLLAFVAEHDTVWYGISFRSVWVSCPSYAPSQPLAHPQPEGTLLERQS